MVIGAKLVDSDSSSDGSGYSSGKGSSALNIRPMSKIGGQRAKLNKILDISVCSDFDSNATIQSAEEDDAIMEEEEEEKNQDHKAIFSKLVLSERFLFFFG